MALLGHHGDVIIPLYSSSESAVGLVVGEGEEANTRKVMIGFQVSRDFNFLSLHEKQAVDQVCQLGFYYLAIETFIAKFRRPVLTKTSSEHGSSSAVTTAHSKGVPMRSSHISVMSKHKSMGLFARALCTGLEEVLSQYRQLVVEAEQLIVADPHFPLLKLRSTLADFFVIFPALQSLVQEISHSPGMRALGGGEILQALHHRSLVGIRALERVINRLLYHCHKVLFNQISSWVVNGTLSDPYQEFFIRQTTIRALKAAVGEEELNGLEDLDVSLPPPGYNDVPEHSWHMQFKLRMTMLPDYISMALAEKILFIGKAVHIIHACDLGSGSGWKDEEEEDKVTRDKVESSSTLILSPLLQHEQVVEFLSTIQKLREAEAFDAVALNLAVDKMRDCVTRLLWDLVVTKSKLSTHLSFAKDFFLVGKGEFFQVILVCYHYLVSSQGFFSE